MKDRVLRWLTRRLKSHKYVSPEQVAASHNRFLYSPRADWWVNRGWMAPYADALEGDRIPEYGQTETRILDRRFFLKECADAARKLKGCTAECGVYKGVGSAIICTAMADTYGPEDSHFGFDSFEGLPAPSTADQDVGGVVHWVPNQLAVNQGPAGAAISRFPFARLVKGWMPQSLEVVAEKKFRLVHIDVDLYQTTYDVLTFFYPRMVRGGIILCDDYGLTSCPGTKKAMDDFFADKPETVLEVPSGSGFVLVFRPDGGV